MTAQIIKTPKREKIVENAWLFDVDGVITNLEQKTINQPHILEEIIRRLEGGEPVALVTGRSIDFMRERVIAPLIERITDSGLLRNFLAVGEKGGVWITYSQKGEPQDHIDETISSYLKLQEEVRELIEREFSDLTFYDESKKTMISVEMKDGINLEDFHQRQAFLDEELENLIKRCNLSSQLETDPTAIATDIQDKHVGKDFAARRVLAWLKSRDIVPKMAVAIGDSKSDVPMAQEIHNQGLPVTFVFVGKEQDRKDIVRLNLPFPVHFPQGHNESGTLEYLTSNT